MRVFPFALLGAVLAVDPPQSEESLSRILTITKATGNPGDSVDYILTQQGQARTVIRMTIVSEATDAGEVRWLETSIPSGSITLRMRFDELGKGTTTGLMALGADVFEMPPHETKPPPALLAASREATAVATTLETPVGTLHVKRREGTFEKAHVVLWTSDEVPVMHLARAEIVSTKHHQKQELMVIHYTHDGKSAFPTNYTVRSLGDGGYFGDFKQFADLMMEGIPKSLLNEQEKASAPRALDAGSPPAKGKTTPPPPQPPDGGLQPYKPAPQKN
jgi:hypothetical protein